MYIDHSSNAAEKNSRESQAKRSALRSGLVADLSQLNFADSDDRRSFPPTLHGILARNGLFGLTTGLEYGGLELPLQDAMDLISATAAFDVSAASALGIHNFLALPCIEVAHHVPSYRHVMRGAVRGDLCAFALTEPEAGSSPQHIKTSAVMVDDRIQLNGRKIWIGLADWARWIVCFARASGPDAKGRLVGVLVDRSNPGLRITHEHRTLGLRGIIQNTIEFKDLVVSGDYALSRDQDAWGAATSSMNRGRIAVAAIGLGAADRSIQIASTYVSHRRISKSLLSDNSYIEQSLEQLILRREVMKAMISGSCRITSGRNIPNPYLVAATKIISSEWSGLIIDRCVQLLGGRGYDEGLPVAKIYRDARILRIFEGPTESLLSHLGRCALSMATRDEVADVFASLDATRTHADIISSAVGLDRNDGAVLVHVGWLTAMGLAHAVVSSGQFSKSFRMPAALNLVESELATLRALMPVPRDAMDRQRARQSLDAFMSETSLSILSPRLSDDQLSLQGYA